MAEENPENQTTMGKLVALLGKSAEYSIAFALVAVCLIVGIAVWLLQPGKPPANAQTYQPSQTTQTHSAAAGGVADEQAALGAWKKNLEGGFDQASQRPSRTEDRKEIQERKQQAEEPPTRLQAKAPQPVEAPAPTAIAAPRVAVAQPAPVVALPKPQPVRTNAAIDWSSCKRPEYPDASIRKNEEGIVVIDVSLAVDARILSSKVSESSGHSRLDTATQRAIEKCRFHPATLDGRPQASTAVVRFTWALQKK
ncbi:MAG: TonB family protein [Pseudomonadota bacterium]